MAAILLGLLAVGVYTRSLGNGFLEWDDGTYVVKNTNVGRLSWGTVRWAFTAFYASNWHPLTWMSHGLDCALYGLERPWGHHLTNLLLHGVNAGLLFVVLRRLTGRAWPSLIVAAVFALHPLRVEVVTWVSERKELLCTLFSFLMLWLYAGYARRPSAGRYVAVAAAFVAALMSKPMAVTLPFVLLLLDWWPLKRLSWRRVLEKGPMFLLAAASCVVTYIAQESAKPPPGLIGAAQRIGNAAVAYVAYLGKLVLPAPGTLLPLYTHPAFMPTGLSAVAVAGSLIVIAGLTALVVLQWRRRPYLAVGWFWYLGMLVPVIGLVQVGVQSMADRYTYLPLIGPVAAVVWLAAEFVEKRPGLAKAGVGAAVIAAGVLSWLTWEQQGAWRDTISLWEYNIRGEPQSAMVCVRLGDAYERKGRVAEAMAQYEEALRLRPGYYEAHDSMGYVLIRIGAVDAGISHLKESLRLERRNIFALNNLGQAYLMKNRPEEAMPLFTKALEIDRQNVAARNNLGNALLRLDRIDAAVEQFNEAIAADPDEPAAYVNLGNALTKRGDFAGAVSHYRKAAGLNPSLVQPFEGWGKAELGRRRPDLALSPFETALRLDSSCARAYVNLGNALYLTGRRDEAAARFREAIGLDPKTAGAHLGLGIILQEQGDREGAKFHIEEGLRLRDASDSDPAGPGESGTSP